MIQLFINGKLVDYVSKPDVGFYVKLGYDVKVLNAEEAEDWRHMNKIKSVWKNLPAVLRKRVRFVLNNKTLRWTERYHAMVRILQVILKRVKGFTVVSGLNRRKDSLLEKIIRILTELVDFLTPQSAAQYALARA